MQPDAPTKADQTARILPGFEHLGGYLDLPEQTALMAELAAIVAAAPLYRPTMPKTGKPFSIRMTNCGPLGWVSDQVGGYRYQPTHPQSRQPWPALPVSLLALWTRIAGYRAPPEACLINHYTAGTRLGSHVDAEEHDSAAPVLSVSLGDDATFHVGGLKRTDPKTRILLRSGDIVVLGGAARLAYHGIDRIFPGTSTLVPWGGRINLTLRRVNHPQAEV